MVSFQYATKNQLFLNLCMLITKLEIMIQTNERKKEDIL